MSSTGKIKTVPALEARTQLGRLMKEIRGGGLRILVEKSGVPMVGIISAEDFSRLVSEREARFSVLDRIRRRLPAVSEKRLGRDVAEALREVRRRRRA
ncbi:MAG: type II toxin-antitoxin system prevent-host-death family antitoxin [Thermoanaerobaculia bacterium]